MSKTPYEVGYEDGKAAADRERTSPAERGTMSKTPYEVGYEDGKAAAVRRLERRKVTRCMDCGEIGERTGHMTCQYPQDH